MTEEPKPTPTSRIDSLLALYHESASGTFTREDVRKIVETVAAETASMLSVEAIRRLGVLQALVPSATEDAAPYALAYWRAT